MYCRLCTTTLELNRTGMQTGKPESEALGSRMEAQPQLHISLHLAPFEPTTETILLVGARGWGPKASLWVSSNLRDNDII